MASGGRVVYISAYITGMIYVDKYFILDGYITQVSTNTNTRAEHLLHFVLKAKHLFQLNSKALSSRQLCFLGLGGIINHQDCFNNLSFLLERFHFDNIFISLLVNAFPINIFYIFLSPSYLLTQFVFCREPGVDIDDNKTSLVIFNLNKRFKKFSISIIFTQSIANFNSVYWGQSIEMKQQNESFDACER